MKKSVRLVRTQADSPRRATERVLSGFLLFFIFAAMFFIVAPSWALDGALDTSFGTGGIVIGSSYVNARALGIQSDGKIVAAGSSYNGSNTDFAVVRYNTDGTPDTSFGTGGIVATAIGSSYEEAWALGIQSDGKIVAAGYSSNGSDYDFALVRYNTDGTLDASFGTGGKITTNFGGYDDVAIALGIQSDGKIVAAGYCYGFNDGNDDFALVRYNTDGTLDTSFGTGGIVATSIGSYNDIAYALGIQSDGKIVAAGYSSNGSNTDFAVVRYNTDGTPDTSFGAGGKVITAIGSSYDEAYALGIQSDGKIVAAGYSLNGSSSYDFTVVRYNTDGTLDTSFGTGGIVATDTGSYTDVAYALGIQSDGKIVAAGYSHNGSNTDFAVVRYNTDGTPDTTFGAGGKITTAIGSGNEEAYALGIQSDGKIVVAGKYNTDFAVARYLATDSGTGPRNASGIYTWDSGTGALDLNWTSSDFICDGPELGLESMTGVTITDTTMTWPPPDDMTWTRTPGTPGDIVGVWTFTDAGSGNSYTLTINSNGTFSLAANIIQCSGMPDISSSPTSLDFGSVTVNTTSIQQIVTFTNTGTADLNVSGGELMGIDALMFAVTGAGATPCNPPFTAPPGASCTLGFTFTPTSAGTKTATFRVYSNDPDSPNFDVPLSGTGMSPSPLYVVWQDDTLTPGNMDIFMKKSTDNGLTWTWQQISNNAGNSQLPVLAVDNTSAVYVVWQDNTFGNNDIYMKKSTDNGLTWTWQQISNNAGNSQLPVLAVDNANAVYVVWQDNTLGNNDIYMKKSTDNGVTWTWQQISNNAGNSQSPVLAVDNTNAVYVVWQDDTLTPGSNDIFMKKSTDNGVTWTWQQISNNAGNSQLPMLAVDNANAVYVVWQDNTFGNNDIYMKKSTDNGLTWTWQQISNNAGNSLSPKIAVDNSNAVYVVWQDDTLTPGNSDIFMKKSTDNGVTWTWQQISNNAGNSQSPVLAVDNTNAVYVVWQDNTLGSNDIFMKKSTDNGVTWTWQQISNNAGNSIMPALPR